MSGSGKPEGRSTGTVRLGLIYIFLPLCVHIGSEKSLSFSAADVLVDVDDVLIPGVGLDAPGAVVIAAGSTRGSWPDRGGGGCEAEFSGVGVFEPPGPIFPPAPRGGLVICRAMSRLEVCSPRRKVRRVAMVG